MNLAQSPTLPTPSVPINVLLPDLKKWEVTEDAFRIAEKKELIAETLEELKTVLAYPMTVQQIRELMPHAAPALKNWVLIWTQQGHLTRRRIGSAYLYSLVKGSE